MRTHPFHPNVVLVLACLLAILFFLLDAAVAQSYLWGSYLLPILFVYLWGRRRDIYIVTALASVLVVAAYWFDPAGLGDLVVNHLLPLIILSAAALLLAQRRQLQEQMAQRQQDLDAQVATRTAALQASEEQLAKIFRANPGGIAITRQSDGCFLEANEAYLAMVGCSREQLIGHTSRELGILAAEQRDRIRAAVLENGAVRGMNVQIHHARGQTVDTVYSVEQLTLAGEPCFLILAVDVSERAQLEAHAQRLAALVEASPDAIMSAALDGTIVSLNRSAEELYGTSLAAVVGQNMVRLTPPEYVEPLQVMLGRVGRGEAVVLDDVTWQLPGGSSRTLSISLSPIHDNTEQVVGFASIARDQTARRQLEAALRTSEENYRALFNQAGDGIFSVDAAGRYLEANDRYCRLLGRSRAEIVGAHLNDMTVGITPEFFAAVGEQIARDGSATFERRLRYKDGTFPEVEVTVSPLSAGRRMAIVRDLGERKAAERELTRLAAIVQASQDAIISADLDGTLRTMNRAAEHLLGIAAGEAVGQHISLLNPDLPESERAAMFARLRAGETFTLPDMIWTAHDGRRVDLSVTALPLFDSAGQALGAASIARDITKRKTAEQSLHASEERFAKLFNASPVGITLSRLADGLYQEANDAFQTMVGYSREELIGHTSLELNVIDVEDRMRLAAALREQGSLRGTDLVLRTKSGELLDTIYSIEIMDFAGESWLLSSVVDITERKRLEERVTRLAAIVESSSDAIVSTDLKGRVVSWNHSAEQIYGCRAAAAIGHRIDELLPPSHAADEAAIVDSVRDGATMPLADRHWTKADGTTVDLSIILSPVKDTHGAVIGMASLARDITQRKRLEAELRQSEERFRSMFAEHAAVMLLIDPATGRIVDSNQAASDFYGYTSAALHAMKIWDISTRPPAEVQAQMQRARNREWNAFIFRHRLADGTVRDVEVHTSPINAGSGTLLYSIIHDVTARREAEEALRQSERKYRDLYDNSPDMYMSGSPADRLIRECNLTLARTLGYTQEELIGRPISMVYTPLSFSRVLAELPRYLAAGEYANLEVQLQCKDGAVIDALLSGHLQPATADRPAYSRVTLRNITERKRAQDALAISEAQLRESQARYQRLADHATDVIWTMDPAGKVNYVSPSSVRQSGFTPEETMCQTLEEAFAPSSRTAVRAAVGELYRLIRCRLPVPANANVYEMLRKDGTTYWGETIYSVVYNEQGEFQQIVGATREATMRVNAERKLGEAFQRLRLAADAANIGIWNWNLGDNSLEWDDRMYKIYGVPEDQWPKGITYDVWHSRIHPEDLALAEPGQGDLSQLGSEWSGVYRIVLPGGAVRYIQASSVMEYDSDGRPLRAIGINRDITDQKRYEQLLHDTNAVLEERVADRTADLRIALAELRRANELKDEFLAMISHELRTPLTGVLSMSEILEEQIAGPLNERQVYYVKGIITSGERLLNVVNGILGYTHLLSGKVQLHAEPCEFSYLLDTCAASQRHKAAAKQQSIAVQVEPPALAITSDTTALAEVLKRLLDNAVKFTPEGGRVGLEAHPGTAPETADLVVWDTGIGIPADQQEHVFRAFTQADGRLQRSHEGIGIGLAYVDEMVRLLGGRLVMESAPGQGSRFTITLPAQR